MGSTLGGAFGIAIMTSIYTGMIQNGYHLNTAAGISFVVGACLIICAICTSVFVLPTRKINS